MLKCAMRVLKTIILRKPIFCIFRVTNRCNLTCRMCSVWRHADKSRELNLLEIQRLAKTLKKLNVSIVNIGGGEPFMRKDLVDIVRIFSKDFSVRMQTNATLVDEDSVRRLTGTGLEGVSISLDTLNPDKQDYICNSKGVWYKTVEKMLLFANILPKRGTLLLSNAIVSKLNIHELPKLAMFVNKLGFRAVFLPVLLSEKQNHNYTFRDYAPNLAFSKEDHPLIDRIYTELIYMKRRGWRIENSFPFLRESAVFLKRNYRWKCDAARLYFHIDADGTFLPCTELSSDLSLLDDDFVQRFYSSSFRKLMQDKIKSCPGCLQPCQVELSKVIHDPGVAIEKAAGCLQLGIKKRQPLIYEEAIKYANFDL